MYHEGGKLTNEEEVDQFLDYLFRTDRDQAWTTEYIEHNLLITVHDNQTRIYPFGSSMMQRIELRDDIVRDFLHRTAFHDTNKVIVHDKLDYDPYREDTGAIHDVSSLSSYRRSDIVGKLVTESTKDRNTVFYVVHADQTDMPEHIHSIYIENGASDW